MEIYGECIKQKIPPTCWRERAFISLLLVVVMITDNSPISRPYKWYQKNRQYSVLSSFILSCRGSTRSATLPGLTPLAWMYAK